VRDAQRCLAIRHRPSVGCCRMSLRVNDALGGNGRGLGPAVFVSFDTDMT
jgi:hypothetical protein